MLATAFGVWWYLQDQKLRDELWLEEDVKWNAALIKGNKEIMERQSEITEELATQTLRLTEIDALINRQWQQGRQRFESLENDNKLLLQAIYQMNADIATVLGRHQGHHDLLDGR